MALALSVLSACSAPASEKKADGANKDAEQQQKKEESKEGEAKDDQKTVDKSEQLIIYTNSGSDGRAEWLTQKAKEAGYHIQVVNMGGSDVANRLVAEKNNVQADMVIGLNALEYEKLKKHELLAKFEPAWVGEVDMTIGDAQGYYFPIVVQPLVLMYNNELKNPPADWTSLIEEQYKDQYTLFTLSGGTGKAIYASIISRYLDEKGDLGVSEEGWNMIKAIFDNGHFKVDGEDNVGNAIDGTRPMTTMWGSGVLQNQKERNYKFGIMSPEVGVPFVVEQVAILDKSAKKDLALDFINWFGAPEFQLEWSNQFGTIPAAKKALDQASDEIKEFMSKVQPQNMNWTVISENIEKWVEKAELELMN